MVTYMCVPTLFVLHISFSMSLSCHRGLLRLLLHSGGCLQLCFYNGGLLVLLRRDICCGFCFDGRRLLPINNIG